MNDHELSKVLALVSVYWPQTRQPSSDADAVFMRDAWGRLLFDVDALAVLAAVEQLAAEGDRFAPPPGLIRKRATILLDPGLRSRSPEEGWMMIKQKIRARGWTSALDVCPDCLRANDGEDIRVRRAECEHHWVTFDDPAVQAFVDAVGWKYLCESENEMADRAHFVKWYPAAVERLSNRAALPESVKLLTAQVAATLVLERESRG